MSKKQLIFWGLVGLTNWLFWWTAAGWLNDPLNWRQWSNWLWPLIWLTVTIALTVLFFALSEKSRGVYGLVLIVLGEFWLVFLSLSSLILLGGTGLAFFLFLSSLQSIRREKENRIDFQLKSVLHFGISRVLTAVFILLSFVYFLTPGVQATALSRELPPSLAKIAQVLTINYLDENLPADNSHLKTQFSREIIKQLTDFLRPHFKFLPPLLAFSLFLILQGLSFVFWRLVLAVSGIIFLMLKYLKVIRIEKVNKEVERIAFS